MGTPQNIQKRPNHHPYYPLHGWGRLPWRQNRNHGRGKDDMLRFEYLPEKQIRSWLQSNFYQVISNCRRNAHFQHRKKAYSSCKDSLKCGSWPVYSTSHGKSEIIFTNVQLNRLKKGIAQISVIRYKYHYIGISLFASWVIALKETWTWRSKSRPSSGKISNHSSRQWKGVIKRGKIKVKL